MPAPLGRVELTDSEYGPPEGPAFVLLHGFPFDRSMWGSQAAHLARHGFHVIAPDLPGHGRSPPGGEGTSMTDMASDVLALLDRLGVREFTLGGFSLGGYVAFEVVRAAPDRVRALALVDTRAEPDTEEAKKGRADTAEAVRKGGAQAIVDRMLPKLLTESTRKNRPELVESVRRLMLEMPPQGAIEALAAMAQRRDQRPLLPEIQVPTLVVVGSEDALTPPESAKVMAEGIPKARLEVVPNAAHLVPMEQAELLNQALASWAARLRASP